MKVVVDTNVLISAAVAGRNPEKVLVFIVNSSKIEWLVSVEILAEYKEVLSRPRLKLAEAQQQRWFKVIDTATRLIDVDIEVDLPRDRKDAKFIACALAGNANFLITGDRDFTEVDSLGETRIISVSLFKQLVVDVMEE